MLLKLFEMFPSETGLDGYCILAIPGLSFVCSKSWKRYYRTFHGAPCELLQGIITDTGSWIHYMLIQFINYFAEQFWNWKDLFVLFSIGENLKSLVHGLVVQQWKHCWGMEGYMNLHLILCCQILCAMCHFQTLMVSRKMFVLSLMPLSFPIRKGTLLLLLM